jgi:hypothetical protein
LIKAKKIILIMVIQNSPHTKLPSNEVISPGFSVKTKLCSKYSLDVVYFFLVKSCIWSGTRRWQSLIGLGQRLVPEKILNVKLTKLPNRLITLSLFHPSSHSDWFLPYLVTSSCWACCKILEIRTIRMPPCVGLYDDLKYLFLI